MRATITAPQPCPVCAGRGHVIAPAGAFVIGPARAIPGALPAHAFACPRCEGTGLARQAPAALTALPAHVIAFRPGALDFAA